MLKAFHQLLHVGERAVLLTGRLLQGQLSVIGGQTLAVLGPNDAVHEDVAVFQTVHQVLPVGIEAGTDSLIILSTKPRQDARGLL